ncbi:MAG TPA: class I SAM-dependent methyltransferase [Dongiaceae bacterium]|nr:class I SAM-dependent methyltransferase [Dongiaceae bacterium]
MTQSMGAKQGPDLAPAGNADHAKWEFQNRRMLLYALVGNDFGPEPETRLDDIRAYKKNEAQFLIDALDLTATDRVLDLGSGFGFLARVVAPLVAQVVCADISGEFLACAREELRGFANVEFLQIPFADLSALQGLRINKAYANAVFIHFNLFDIVMYLRELHSVLEPGGLFIFGMSDTDTLDIRNDRYFGVVLEKYKQHRGSPVLMHWNSARAVCRAAEASGFLAKVAYSGAGSAMILLEKKR